MATPITVDLSDTTGALKPLHGVNNGPISVGTALDVSHYYREIAVPWVRLHDPNWPHPREVDIPQIFPNEAADPDKPASYDFRQTDAYLNSIRATGAQIIYRLGTSIEWQEPKYFTHPPKDFARWARVCVGIIRHYNHGWADGFRYGITHWEIWNEPDTGPAMWTGTFEQYCALYAAAATAIKAFDPTVKVGGYAAALPKDDKVRHFLAWCRDQQLPLDFFSWHTYAAQPGDIAANARHVRGLLDAHGFNSASSVCDEWNLTWGDCFGPGKEYARRADFQRMKNEVGASFAAAVLILLQDAAVDVANYYDGQPPSLWCGLFDQYGVPQKTFQAFRAFHHLLQYPQRARSQTPTDDPTVHCVAVANPPQQEAAVLLAKFGGARTDYRIEVGGLPVGKDPAIEILLVDQDRNLEPVPPRRAPKPEGERLAVELTLREHAVALIKLR